jgi:hypothetical protein
MIPGEGGMPVFRMPLAPGRMRKPELAVCYLVSVIALMCLLGHVPSTQQKNQLLGEPCVAGAGGVLGDFDQQGWLLLMGGIRKEERLTGQMMNGCRRNRSEAEAAAEANSRNGRTAVGVERQRTQLHVMGGAEEKLLTQPQEEAYNQKFSLFGFRYSPWRFGLDGCALPRFLPPPTPARAVLLATTVHSFSSTQPQPHH